MIPGQEREIFEISALLPATSLRTGGGVSRVSAAPLDKGPGGCKAGCELGLCAELGAPTVAQAGAETLHQHPLKICASVLHLFYFSKILWKNPCKMFDQPDI